MCAGFDLRSRRVGVILQASFIYIYTQRSVTMDEINLSGKLTIVQSNGFVVDLDIQQDEQNNLSGVASTRSFSKTGTSEGENGVVTGSVKGNQILFTVNWGCGIIVEYDGTFNINGRITGIGLDLTHNALAMWASI